MLILALNNMLFYNGSIMDLKNNSETVLFLEDTLHWFQKWDIFE